MKTPPMTSLRIELLGGFRITRGDTPVGSINTNRLRSLVTYLLLHRDAPQARERLAFLLWPDSEESQARTNLRQLLHHLRRALPGADELVTSDTQTVQWKADASVSLDLAEFEDALARAAQNQSSERESLEQAVRVYQDDLVPELYDEWLQQPREHLRKRLAGALSRLASLLEASREYPAAIGYAERLITLEPLGETHYHHLIRLHTQNHDRAAAIRVYHQCMKTLKRELGVSPGVATRELFERLLKSEAPSAKDKVAPPPTPDSPPPMVGRRDFYDRLRQYWDRAARGGSLLATIQGEAGIGKSRLAEELFLFVSNDSAAVRTRCYAAQGQLAYGPLADFLRSKTIHAGLSQLPRRQLSELARLLPELLSDGADVPAPQPLTESWQRHHFHEALIAAFRSVPRPLLLWIDDLQWCDRDTIEWLDYLFRSDTAGGILLLATIRTEDTERDHPLIPLCRQLGKSGQLEVLEIGPLTAEETAALGAQVGHGKLDEELCAQLYAETHGNPLYVVESVRSRMEGPVTSAANSVTHSVIAERLGRLSHPAFELAEIAAAAGTSFTFEFLAKASDWDEDSLSRALEELWQRRIIHAQGACAYDFTHDRLREAAYAGQNLVRRRSMHRRVARALEDLFTSDLDAASGQLASHYEAAGMADYAIPYYRRSAKVAQQRYAETEAGTLLKKALALCRDLPPGRKRDHTELELLVTLAPSMRATLGHAAAEAGEIAIRALELAQQPGEDQHLLAVLAGAWIFHVVRGELATARDMGQRFLGRALEQSSPAHAGIGHLLLGSTLFHLSEFERSLQHLEESAKFAGAVRDSSILALELGTDLGVFCTAYLSHVLWHLGDREQAAEKSAQSIARAEEISHPFSLALALTYAAMFRSFQSDSVAARAYADRAIELCAQYQFAYYLAIANILSGAAKAFTGSIPEGLTQLRRGLEDFRSTGAELRLPFYYALLERACALAGRPDESAASIATGLAFERKNSETWVNLGNAGDLVACSTL